MILRPACKLGLSCSRHSWHLSALVVLHGAILACAVLGQEPGPADAPEPGFRVTPEMSRGLAGVFARQAIRRRYDLSDEQVEQLQEAMAHRFMEHAHRFDTAEQQQIMEHMFAEVFAGLADHAGGPHRGIPPRAAQAYARANRQYLPNFRELVRDVGQDLRGMLPVKQQLKLAGDLMAVGTALDAFESTLDRWAQGDVRPFDNPFDASDDGIRRDDSGVSRDLQRAREAATELAETDASEGWSRYVDDAIAYFRFNDAQTASARSLLREFLDRASQLSNDGQYREQRYRARLWQDLLGRRGIDADHPMRELLDRREGRLQEPMRELDKEFKRRIDSIATAAQRQAAEQRMLDLLAERGHLIDRPSFATPAAGASTTEPSDDSGASSETEPQEPPEP